MNNVPNINNIKKDLLKSKVNANFSHYCHGKLYYTVQLTDGSILQFPISVIEESVGERGLEMALSADLGTTPFNASIKASELNRWIAKAYSNDEVICINKAPQVVDDLSVNTQG